MARYELAGRTIAITGSSGGLGSALASRLHTRGANLALMGQDLDALELVPDLNHMIGSLRGALAELTAAAKASPGGDL